MRSNGLFLLGCLFACSVYGQGTLKGRVVIQNQGQKEPLEAVKLYWLHTPSIRPVYTDSLGRFSLPRAKDSLVVSMIGFYGDTLFIGNTPFVEITLFPIEGDEVVIVGRKRATYISTKNPFLTETLTEQEFKKAACCNLSESFETNPSVDANYSDAITGTKQIQMLGLASIYSTISVENMPGIRGLLSSHGLTFFPSAWVESIQISKGTASVVNGYEGITGQINIELKKPDTLETGSAPHFVNFYTNNMLRSEWNYAKGYRLGSNWRGMSLAHASMLPLRVDMNHDGFLDMPVGYQGHYLQRVHFRYPRWEGILTAGGLYDVKQSGQVQYRSSSHVEDTYYGVVNRNQRGAFTAKIGYLFPDKAYQSIGNQFSFSRHAMHFDYGRNHYEGLQTSVYYNGIFQTILSDTRHGIKLGLSFLGDFYRMRWNGMDLSRDEYVPGTFLEYSWKPVERFTLLMGNRLDYHSRFGFWYTPRLHLRYELTRDLILRASGGKGTRTPLAFNDYWNSFISSRRVIWGDSSSSWLGLGPEVAWNYGGSVQWKFNIRSRAMSVVLDYYRTDFVQQVVVDRDANSLELRFYNLSGLSYSNALQVSLDGEVLRDLEVRLAYKYYDVRQTIGGRLREVPLISRHRGMVNVSYRLPRGVSLDLTVQYHGRKRLPDTFSSPPEFRLTSYSRAFWLWMGQVNYRYKGWEFYFGGENLGNFRQLMPIVSYREPFREYFDAGMVWGPIYGLMGYLGFRVTIL